MKNILISIFITALVFVFWANYQYPKAFYYIDTAYEYVEYGIAYFGNTLLNAGLQIGAALLHDPVTVQELQSKYKSSNRGTLEKIIKNEPEKKVRILIVPGHEPNYGGTNFGNLFERDMNVELARNLVGFIKNNGSYDVMVSRDENNWNPVLLEYFKTQWDEIALFFKDNKEETLHLVKSGQATKPIAKVAHNKARSDVALRLYGINKWENENEIDIAIHVHFNDYPRANASQVGRYSGFSIYVPERQYANNATTKAIAETVFKRLAKYNAVSNLPQEDEGIIESPDLIAIGAYNTTNSASMLIEYGYIYEPQFTNPEVRSSTLKDLAFQTYLGLQDFFGAGNDVSLAYDTLMLPHSWKNELSSGKGSSEDVLALQSALLIDGVYPGNGKTKNDCPRSGKIGPCTLSAIEAFQKKYGITDESNIVGEKTREMLNNKYSVRAI